MRPQFTRIYIEIVNRIVFSVHFLNKFVSLLKLLPIYKCATKGGLYVPHCYTFSNNRYIAHVALTLLSVASLIDYITVALLYMVMRLLAKHGLDFLKCFIFVPCTSYVA